MEKIRKVVTYKNHFKDFLLKQPQKVQDKIYKIIELIEHQQQIPERFLKHLAGIKGLYETRIMLGTNIWRVFCFFDKGQLVVLLNGFQKKTQKTPKSEIEKAKMLMQEYFNDKNQQS